MNPSNYFWGLLRFWVIILGLGSPSLRKGPSFLKSWNPVILVQLKPMGVDRDPKTGKLPLGYLFQERIWQQGVLEWKLTKDQGEEDDPQSEYASFGGVITFRTHEFKAPCSLLNRGMFKDEDVCGDGLLQLLIGYIAWKANLPCVPQYPDKIGMWQVFEDSELILQVSLFLGFGTGYSLEDDLLLALPEVVYFWLGPDSKRVSSISLAV